MRILLVGDYPRDPKLGSTKVVLKLQEEFRALGHVCDVLLADDLGLETANAHVRRAFAPIAALMAVRRARHANGPYDIIDVASAEGLWLGVWRRLGGLRHTAIVARSNGLEHLDYQRMLDDHAHGLLDKPWTKRIVYPAIRLSQVAAAARVADRLILLNEVDREFALAQGWKKPAQIDLVPHGISSVFLASAPGRDAARGNGLLFCGSWADVKGTRYLAQAFSDLIAAGVAARLTILGGAVDDDAIRSAFSEAARPFITIRPRVSEAEVMAAYRTHDLLVAPSTYEGFGMVVLEAMSQRLPVVSTPVGGARTLVTDGITGLVVPPRDAAALAAALRRALGDEALRRRMAAAAFETVRSMTWTRTAEATIAAYAKTRAVPSTRVLNEPVDMGTHSKEPRVG
jgi:glycosyltransferase involved in cell wall biosynthesis